jgi:hypothetical protein
LAISMFLIQLSVSYRIAGGCVIVSSDGMLFLERLRYVGIVLLEKGLHLFSPSAGSSFWPPVMLLAVADLPFRLLVMMLATSDLMFGSTFRRYGRCVDEAS